MLEHSRVKDLLSDYIDGELPEETARQVEGHLEGCDACRNEYNTLKQTVAAVAGLGPVRAPEDFASKVNLRLRRRLRHRPELRTSLEQKIPYETICLLMLAILAALYIILYLMPLMDVDMRYQGPEERPERRIERPDRNKPRQDAPPGARGRPAPGRQPP